MKRRGRSAWRTGGAPTGRTRPGRRSPRTLDRREFESRFWRNIPLPLDPHLFQLYLAAALVLVLLPGPDSLLVLGNSLFEGRRAGWVTAGGCFAGNIVHAGLAAAGVSALVAASPALFDALRLAGAGYLAWIGVRSLRSAWLTWRTGEGVAVPAGQGGGGRRSFFARALVTNLLNAKVILFYLAFVPQFVTPALGSVWLQTLVLGLVLAVMGCLYHLALAGLAAGAARRVAGNARFRAALDGVAGLLFLGFAARLLLAERRLA